MAGLRLARRVEQVSRQIDEEIKPLLSNLTQVAAEAARTASLASRQVERVDALFSDVAARVDETLASARQLVGGPAKERDGGARAASRRRSRPSRAFARRHAGAAICGRALDDEDSLFIG